MKSERGFLQGPTLYLVVALTAVLILAGGVIWVLDEKLKEANERIASLREDLGKEEQSRRGFQESAIECSNRTAELEARSRKTAAELEKKRRESQELSRVVQGHIQAMLNRPRPGGLDECQAMRKELDDEIDYRAARPR